MNRAWIPARTPHLLCGFAFLTGCGTEPRVTNEPSPEVPATAVVNERSDRGQRLPLPDAAEIAYDSDSQVLRLYDLPAPARWMVQLPNDRRAVPVDRDYKLPDGSDLDKTLVYYTQPGGRQSKVLTLREIQRARDAHAQRAVIGMFQDIGLIGLISPIRPM